jgi:hypothetical protein
MGYFMDKQVLVLYDSEEEYTRLMGEFMRTHRELPWEIHTYTDADKMSAGELSNEINILLVSESDYRETSEKIEKMQPKKMIILNESGLKLPEGITGIDKYRQAENVLRELLEIYAEIMDTSMPGTAGNYKTKFIGLYSPVRRCLQTSFGLTMAQILAEERKTLYLNFEHYAGMMTLLPDSDSRDLADLLYFLNADKDKFRLRMQTIVRQLGALYYVPPMKAGQNLITVTEEEWFNLMRRIEESGEFEYVVMDLTESMQGLFNILRSCKAVFTLTKDDRLATSKMIQYEQLLALCEYDDVLDKTRKFCVPHIRRLPDSPEQYTRGELAEYVKAQMADL